MPFDRESLEFLRSLELNNNREWFQPRKEEYERKLRQPMLQLCAELNGRELGGTDYVNDPGQSRTADLS